MRARKVELLPAAECKATGYILVFCSLIAHMLEFKVWLFPGYNSWKRNSIRLPLGEAIEPAERGTGEALGTKTPMLVSWGFLDELRRGLRKQMEEVRSQEEALQRLQQQAVEPWSIVIHLWKLNFLEPFLWWWHFFQSAFQNRFGDRGWMAQNRNTWKLL